MHSIASRVTYWNTENNRRIKGIDEGALNGRPYLCAENRQNIYNYRRRYRGVAQLVAYVLWEHGVESSSLVTSTKNKAADSCSLFCYSFISIIPGSLAVTILLRLTSQRIQVSFPPSLLPSRYRPMRP